MIPTPSLSHLSKVDFEKIYQPAEDTFVFLDALEADADRLRAQKPRLIVEIGSGSGCVSAFMAAILGSEEAAYLCTDINPHAAQCTFKTGKENKAHLESVLTSLLSCLLPRVQGLPADHTSTNPSRSTKMLDGLVDVLLFNPPYVPTSEEEETLAQHDRSLSGSWAGGSLGVKLLHSLIDDAGWSSVPFATAPTGPQEEEKDGEQWWQRRQEAEVAMMTPIPKGGIESILSPKGSFYCVAIQQNDPQDILRRLEARGLAAQVVLNRRAGREHLFVIRGSKR